MLFLIGRLQYCVQQHICACFTILPATSFYFDMATAADAGNKNHRGWTNLIHIAGVMSRTADHVQIGISQSLGLVQNKLHPLFIKGGVLYPPGFFDFDRTAPAGGDVLKILANQLPRFYGMVIIPGADVHGKVNLIRDDVSGVRVILNFTDRGHHVAAHTAREIIDF